MNNLSIKAKLLIIPILLVCVFVATYLSYSNSNTAAQNALNRASEAKVVVSDFLKTRISIYQFLRKPDNTTLDKVHTNLEDNKKKITELKSLLSLEANRKKCDEAIALAEKYGNDFDKIAPQMMKADVTAQQC